MLSVNGDKPQNGLTMLRERDDSSTLLGGWNEEDAFRWKPAPYERLLVKCTWSDDFEFLVELGTSIYMFIFEHMPDVQKLFPNIHRHGNRWRHCAEFRSQALKFVQTISFAANNLHLMEDQRIRTHLMAVGERHVQYAARGFRPDHWNIFLDAMENALKARMDALQNVLTPQQLADARRVWRRLSQYIIVHMKRGYAARLNKNYTLNTCSS